MFVCSLNNYVTNKWCYKVLVLSKIYGLRHKIKNNKTLRFKLFSIFGYIMNIQHIQCPPKVGRQSFRNCSILCCYNIYICIRIKQNNDVNDFFHHTKMYINVQQTCDGIVEIYFMPEVSEIQKHILLLCFHKINIGCNRTENYHTISRTTYPLLN